ncbi:MAG: glycosyltransferase family 4 protein [Synechococcales cyanobacterium RU_4_20]|nr:glycosyltransferase family 4 protein [Synechococcales cyanobacterium RU_4_20]
MHIAWLGKKSPFCGNVTYSREVTNALLDRGHQVSFFHFAQRRNPGDPLPDAQEVSIPCLYKSQIYTIPSPRSSKVLVDALKALAPDVVHASLTLSPLDFRLPEICEELGIPLVATFHPPFDHKVRNLTSGTQHLTYQVYAPCLAKYDRVIVFSNLQRDLLHRLGVPTIALLSFRTGLIPIAIVPGYYPLARELNAERVFIYQGRISTEKNIEALLKAWKLADMGPQCRLVIVGDGPLKPSLELAYGADLGIVWLGFEASEQRRIQLLQGADVFILPSLVEGLSLSLLEAMSCGVACLATDAGADGEVLDQGAGVVLNTQRVTAQLQTLLPLFRDHPEMTQLLGRKARQRVLERYILSQNISHVEAVYQALNAGPLKRRLSCIPTHLV